MTARYARRAAPRRRLRRLLRGRPRALRRRPAPVQARPDGAPHPHLRASAAAPTTSPTTSAPEAPTRDELDAFLDRVTINVSQLWRNPEQWTRARRATSCPSSPGRGRMRAWSAGCSYGAEAYTLAAVCREAVPRRARRDHRAPTSTAAWSPAPARGASPPTTPAARRAPRCDRWFEPRGGGRRRDRSCAGSCRFETGDLLRMPVPRGAYDLVLCRNTVIYFTEEVRDALHARLVEPSRPGGYLVVGTTERVADARELGLDLPVPLHLPQELADGHLRVPPHVPRRGRASTSRSSTSPSSASRSSPTTARRSTRSSASRTR